MSWHDDDNIFGYDDDDDDGDDPSAVGTGVMMITTYSVWWRWHWWSSVGTGVAGGPSVNKFHEVSLPTSHPYNCRHYHRHQHHHCHPGHRRHHHHHCCHHHRDAHRLHLYVLPLSFNLGQDCRVNLEHCLDVKKLPLRQETLTNSAKPRKVHTTQDKSDKDANKSKRSTDIFLQIENKGWNKPWSVALSRTIERRRTLTSTATNPFSPLSKHGPAFLRGEWKCVLAEQRMRSGPSQNDFNRFLFSFFI